MQKQTENFLKFLLEDDEAFEKRYLSNLNEVERKAFEEEISKSVTEDEK